MLSELLIALAVWLVVAVAVALILGRIVREAERDRHGPRQPGVDR